MKLGMAGETAKDLVGGGIAATQALLSEYNAQTPLPTLGARTPAVNDDLKTEARNLMALQYQATPLQGGQNPELLQGVNVGVGGYSTLTPRGNHAVTPSPLLAMTPRGPTPAHGARVTPGFARTLATPVRDNFHINPTTEDRSVVAATPGSVISTVADPREMKRRLKHELQALPEPRNEFEIVVPDDEKEASPGIPSASGELDESEREEQQRQDLARREFELYDQQSSMRKRGLPVPKTHLFTLTEDANEVTQMIEETMVRMIKADLDSTAERPSVDYNYLKKARALMDSITPAPSSVETSPTLIYVPSLQKSIAETSPSPEQRLEAMKYEYDVCQKQLVSNSSDMNAMVAKIQKKQGGYAARSEKLSAQITTYSQQRQNAAVRLRCFTAMAEHEETYAIPTRINEMQNEVYDLVEKEARMQRRYKQLLDGLQHAPIQ